jgi:Tol biopolymer transport system component
MNKQIRFFPAFLALTIAILACSLSPFGIDGTQPASPDQVGTAVALTLQAVTPEPSTSLLPHAFYYLGTDDAGLTQVFRIERDGTSRRQLTSEPVNVSDYDVSATDGSVAYVANNQLFFVNAEGSGRRVLVEGGPVDENNPFLSLINSPVFSPDGQTLAYGYKGLNIYNVSTGASDLVIENQIDDRGSGFLFPKELYWPEHYSPDGSKLLITLGYYEGASAAIFDPASNSLVRLTGGEGALICCDEMEWAADGTSFYSASPAAGMFNSGLWRVDASTGAVTTLLASNFDSGSFVYADEPYLAPDGQLYFFFLETTSEFNMRAPLQLVRSAPDGVTRRTAILADTFELMNEALWAPDASFVVVAFAPDQDIHQGGRAEIVYLDGRPNVLLTPFAQQIKWGL